MIIKKKKIFLKYFDLMPLSVNLYKTLFTICSIQYSVKVNKKEYIKISTLENKFKSYQIL